MYIITQEALMHSCRAVVATFALILVLVSLIACAQQGPVTIGGKPITDEALVIAVVVVHDVEVGAVAIGDFLIVRHRTACFGLAEAAKLTVEACVTATSHLKHYATTYAPKILTALQGARDALRIAATQPTETTAGKVQAVIALATSALQTAVDWATSHGFRKVTP